jgi:hypothetical protein
MRKSRFVVAALLAAAVAVAAFAPGIAPASKSVSFSGSYKGTASVVKKGSAITITSLKGSGKGTLGLNKVSGKGSGKKTSSSCASFGGPATISGSSGSIKLTASSKSLGCKASGDSITIKGTATVSGGSGKFGKAKGTLSFKGSFNEKTGAFSATVSGKLSL